MTEVYSNYETRHLKELGEYDDNVIINDLINYKLPNTSEPTVFSEWSACLEQSVKQNVAVIDEWGQMN